MVPLGFEPRFWDSKSQVITNYTMEPFYSYVLIGLFYLDNCDSLWGEWIWLFLIINNVEITITGWIAVFFSDVNVMPILEKVIERLIK